MILFQTSQHRYQVEKIKPTAETSIIPEMYQVAENLLPV